MKERWIRVEERGRRGEGQVKERWIRVEER